MSEINFNSELFFSWKSQRLPLYDKSNSDQFNQFVDHRVEIAESIIKQIGNAYSGEYYTIRDQITATMTPAEHIHITMELNRITNAWAGYRKLIDNNSPGPLQAMVNDFFEFVNCLQVEGNDIPYFRLFLEQIRNDIKDIDIPENERFKSFLEHENILSTGTAALKTMEKLFYNPDLTRKPPERIPDFFSPIFPCEENRELWENILMLYRESLQGLNSTMTREVIDAEISPFFEDWNTVIKDQIDRKNIDFSIAGGFYYITGEIGFNHILNDFYADIKGSIRHGKNKAREKAMESIRNILTDNFRRNNAGIKYDRKYIVRKLRPE